MVAVARLLEAEKMTLKDLDKKAPGGCADRRGPGYTARARARAMAWASLSCERDLMYSWVQLPQPKPVA